MNNSIKRILGYVIGFAVISSAIPHPGFKEYCLITLGGCIITASTVLFSDRDDKY